MLSNAYKTPGVYRKDKFLTPSAKLPTAVPVFLGLTQKSPGAPHAPDLFSLVRLDEFEQKFGNPIVSNYLIHAVRGFFGNGGRLCYVVPLEAATHQKLGEALAALKSWDEIDLICAPDIMKTSESVTALQQLLLDHCDKTDDRFAILDSVKGADPAAAENKVLAQRQNLNAANGALYYPWVRVTDGPPDKNLVPPCGHIAGIYARSDQRVGVHKAPANEIVEGVLDLEFVLTNSDQEGLNPQGINCLRVFPGRGIRVWGARTLSKEPDWTYVNVRRLFLTAGRWIERNLTAAAFEPNDPKLWYRITRELTAYFNTLFEQGALKGRTAQEAFYVKCDAETNPSEVRNLGMVVTNVGLAPGVPGEFVEIRIIHGAEGITITGPGGPG